MTLENAADDARRSRLVVLGLPLLVIAVGIAILWKFFVPVDPLSAVVLPMGPEEAMAASAGIAQRMGVERKLERGTADLGRNRHLIQYMRTRHGQEEGTQLLRKTRDGFFWQSIWTPEGAETGGLVVAERRRLAESDDLGDRKAGEVRIRMTSDGRLLMFEKVLPDSQAVASLSEGEAAILADSVVRREFGRFGPIEQTTSSRVEHPQRRDHRFGYSARDSMLGLAVRIDAEVAGSAVVFLSAGYPEAAGQGQDERDSMRGLIVAILILVIAVAVIIIGIRRIRAFEINFRLALWLGAVAGVGAAVPMLARAGDGPAWELWLVFPISLGFSGGAFAVLWAVSESVGREVWREKFVSLDLLRRGYLLHSRVGRGILWGCAAGMAAAALRLLVLHSAGSFIPGLLVSTEPDTFTVLATGYPAPILLLQYLASSLFVATIFGVFLLPLLRTKVRSLLLLAVLGSVVTGFFDRSQVSPFVAGLVIVAIPYLALAWALLASDVLTLLVAAWCATVAGVAPMFFTVGNPTLAGSGAALCAAGAILLLWGVAALVTRDPKVDMDSITPAFVHHITERQRLQRELEIARDVQQSLLPKTDPALESLDVASRCVPAQEVGGDYYDFVDLGEGCLGVAIGDVSGKGTQAAFFMTLTKGFLRAVTRACSSPAEVLRQLNSLFYENVERGTFISMVYAVVNTRAHTLTIARAGHNPALLQRPSEAESTVLLPPGLALGLVPDEQFRPAISEETVEFRGGDMLVLYTDGFTEAMNTRGDEYGEARLRQAMTGLRAGSSRELLDRLFSEARGFAGRARQHDDMTMVVIRRT